MKAKKNGISSILGALIFLQILAISLVLVVHVINNETYTTLKSVQRVQALSEYAPIAETVENNVTYLYSTSPFKITHVIYPDGEIENTNIPVESKLPVSQILNGSSWAIIVTSQGTWYNVTLLGGGNVNSGVITFPDYHDFGDPLNLSVLSVSQLPNWDVLDGIVSSSAVSLVPVNVTIGDPTTYTEALTDAVLVVYPLSPNGWINVTFYQPPESLINSGNPSIYPYYFSGLTFTYNRTNTSLGIYIPTNTIMTFALNDSHEMYMQNISALQYSYIYVNDWEVTDLQIATQSAFAPNEDWSYSWFVPQIGTAELGESEDYYFPLSLLDTPLNNNPLIKYINESPPFNLYDTDLVWHQTCDGLTKIVNMHNFPVMVYQVDINLNKGVVLNYGYDSFNNNWFLLCNYTFNYNNPESYQEAYEQTHEGIYYGDLLGYAIPNGHGGYSLVPLSDIPDPYSNYYLQFPYGSIYLENIANIQYLINYPVYIVVPQGTYLLQVNLS